MLDELMMSPQTVRLGAALLLELSGSDQDQRKQNPVGCKPLFWELGWLTSRLL